MLIIGTSLQGLLSMAMSAVRTSIIRDAAEAYKLLNGIVCLYKPKGMAKKTVWNNIRYKLCEDLNVLERVPRQEVVHFRRLSNGQSVNPIPNPGEQLIAEISDGSGKIEVVKSLSYADHPLIAGPGYQHKDIRLSFASYLGRNSSGLLICGVNNGRTPVLIKLNNWLKTFVVSGEFGKATDTFFHTGRILQKATYHNIRKHMIDHSLAASQATHQRYAFEAAGVPLNSERAYQLASEGVVRPEGTSVPIIYSMKCIKFDPPHFDIELCCVNESEEYLNEFIHQIGMRLHSLAVCTKIRCIKIGPFSLDLALLDKHWRLEHFISNMTKTSTILKNFKLNEREPLILENLV